MTDARGKVVPIWICALLILFVAWQGTAVEFAADQESLNGQTVGNWDFYSAHRAKMTSLIHRAAKKAGTKEQKSVLILGAGNCNDLDLFTLVSADAISKIYLLDIDAHAVQAGVVSQWERVLVKEGLPASLVCEGDSKSTMKGLASVPLDDETTFTVLSSSNPLCSLKRRIYILPSTDVTGIAEDLSLFSSSTTLEEVDRVKVKADTYDLVRRVKDALNDPSFKGFDVVVSDLLFSQIGTYLMTHLGDNRPDIFLPLLLAVRQKHIDNLVSLTLPSGHALFVTDVVSSGTLPELNSMTETELKGAKGHQLLQQLFDQGNFFSGNNVFAIAEAIRQNPRIADTRLVGPWLWFLGHKTHLVCALDLLQYNARK